MTKPIQYVGGEVNAVTKDWDAAEVRWALMYPDAYEVGAPNQGVQILYEVINERDDALAERTYSVWPDLEALMREHGVPQFTVDAHRAVGDFDVFGLSFSTELGYTNMLTAIDLAGRPAAGRRPRRDPSRRGRRRPCGLQPRADRRLRRRRRAGRRRGGGAPHHRHRSRLEARRTPGGPRGAAPPAGPDRLDLRPAVLRRRLPRGRPHPAGRPEPAGRAVARPQAHPHEPRRLGLPEEPAGAAGRDGPRAHGRGDLPRLHARLPLLPGRHDHAARARAQHHQHRRDRRERTEEDGLRGGRACCRCRAPTTPRSPTSPATSPTATRTARRRCRCRARASTRSTSTSPTSCRATAAAAG